MKKSVIVLFILLIITLSSGLYILATKQKSTENNQPHENKTVESKTKKITVQEFEAIKITLRVPSDMDVVKEINYTPKDSSNIESYIFYIQDYKEGNEVNFQIYGIYQLSTPTISYDEFIEIKNDTETYEYVKEIDINGTKGFETLQKGERNNYVYLLHIEERILRLVVSPTSDENKLAAEEIINTLRYYPDMKTVVEVEVEAQNADLEQ